MQYIEKDTNGCFFDPTNCPCAPATPNTTDTETNNERWSWLINGWETMSFKDKLALFTPYVKVIRLYQTKVDDFDVEINNTIIETSFKLCRTLQYVKYDEDHHGSPCFALVFDPIDVNSIPNVTTRSSVRAWGVKYGFLNKDVCRANTALR